MSIVNNLPLRPTIKILRGCVIVSCVKTSLPQYSSLVTRTPCDFTANTFSGLRYFTHTTARVTRKVEGGIENSIKVQSYDRGPVSTETTQTDFGRLDILGNIPAPSTSIDACLWGGFHLNSGLKVTGGVGVLLIGGGAFSWHPWVARKDGELRLLNNKGQWEVEDEAWGIFEIMWPKPDLLILGLGKKMRPLSPKTNSKIHSLGLRVEIQDTRNAAAQFNLLATERGLSNVAAALVPIGWREGVGVQ